jgi:hypothetical protein
MGMVLEDSTEVMRGNTCGEWERIGEVRKRTGVPLHYPLSKRGVMMHEDRQEVARSTLVNGIELKMAALIWRTAPGYLRWNSAIFGFACT